MTSVSRKLVQTWGQLGTRVLPFADAATPDLPLPRLLRLALFQVAVGMALVLLVGTLNRVMIVELGVPAALVAVMIALPVLYAPLRALVGYRSDVHQSALGWRRVPFIWMGTMLQFGGLAVMPFAVLVLSGGGNAAAWPAWVGPAGAAVAFLLVGAGLHTAQTAGLALATDLASPDARPRVVGLMYVMLLLGSIASAVVFGLALREFSPGRLVQVIQGAAVATLVLNSVALWKQEPRRRGGQVPLRCADQGFSQAWHQLMQGPRALRRLMVVALGTLAFGMQDVLLEPYGGQLLAMSVGHTTLLTATLAGGGLLGFGLASLWLGRSTGPGSTETVLLAAAAWRVCSFGALVGVPAFALVAVAAPAQSLLAFVTGVALVGVGGGLFAHGSLTATMSQAPSGQVGLALGAWGAVQATAAGVAVAAGGVLADLVAAFSSVGAGYRFVYLLELGLLIVTLACMAPLWRAGRHAPGDV
jgi:BCD family chlorophyll transporter-like MFS transporter